MASSVEMGEESNAFYLLRKGDTIGIFKNLRDCQAQAGSSVLFHNFAILIFVLTIYHFSVISLIPIWVLLELRDFVEFVLLGLISLEVFLNGRNYIKFM